MVASREKFSDWIFKKIWSLDSDISSGSERKDVGYDLSKCKFFLFKQCLMNEEAVLETEK